MLLPQFQFLFQFLFFLRPELIKLEFHELKDQIMTGIMPQCYVANQNGLNDSITKSKQISLGGYSALQVTQVIMVCVLKKTTL